MLLELLEYTVDGFNGLTFVLIGRIEGAPLEDVGPGPMLAELGGRVGKPPGVNRGTGLSVPLADEVGKTNCPDPGGRLERGPPSI